MTDAEKRQCQRGLMSKAAISLRPLDPHKWFKFWGAGGCTLRDVSLVGVGIVSRDKLPIGTPVSIDLRLEPQNVTIRVFGKVIWTNRDGDNYRSGISFSWWKDDQDKKIVNQYIDGSSSNN